MSDYVMGATMLMQISNGWFVECLEQWFVALYREAAEGMTGAMYIATALNSTAVLAVSYTRL